MQKSTATRRLSILQTQKPTLAKSQSLTSGPILSAVAVAPKQPLLTQQQQKSVSAPIVLASPVSASQVTQTFVLFVFFFFF